MRASEGDEILYNAGFPAKQVNEGSRFSVWVKASIRKIENDQVWLDNAEVLKGFKDKVRNELVIKHSDTISNKFRGNKPIRLTRDERWLIFPKGKKWGVSDFIKQHGHEALTAALGFQQDDKQVIVPEEDPEMRLLDKQSLQNAFHAAGIDGHTYDDTMAIIDDAIVHPDEKVLTTTGVMNLFDAETPSTRTSLMLSMQ